MRRIAPSLGISLAAVAALAVAAVDWTPAAAASAAHPAHPARTASTAQLAGVNNFSCKPTTEHPRPVVLVHGTFATMGEFVALAPRLARAGYCVFALNYGCQNGQQLVCATAPIEDSARQLAAFIDRVLAASGAPQVDLVGHSQGGMMPRQYLKFLGGSTKVHQLIGLAPSNHGTTVDGLKALVAAIPGGSTLCDACQEQLAGSAFLAELNAGGDTAPAVRYTVIETRYDEVVTPYSSAFLSGTSVTNVLLQDTCPLDLTGHAAIVVDPNAIGWVLHALDPTSPAPDCVLFGLPL